MPNVDLDRVRDQEYVLISRRAGVSPHNAYLLGWPTMDIDEWDDRAPNCPRLRPPRLRPQGG
jgi:hypothetical protein